jgi:hypothetical protein
MLKSFFIVSIAIEVFKKNFDRDLAVHIISHVICAHQTEKKLIQALYDTELLFYNATKI